MAPSATACALSAAAAAMEDSVNPFRAFAMAVQPETSAVFTAAAASAAACAFVAAVAAMAAKLNVFGTISDDASTYHNDYGVAAVSQFLEQGGQDMPCSTSGYNWFGTAQNYSDRLYTSTGDELIWKTFYNHLKAANNVLTLTAGSEDESMKRYRGQALAARAYDYLNLAQIYQFTYAGHENELCVPIVTETMTEEEMQTNPRATVQQVYDQIMNDLNQSIELLAGFDNGSNMMQKRLLPVVLRRH